ncbi:MAG: hypothetical protein ACR2NQ_05790, partial [Thermodesulfobacteriota bacterium]
DFPPLQILLSECEEGSMFRQHEDLLKGQGEGLYSGIGAERISKYLVKNNTLPSLVVVVDVTPLFGGEPGVALYSNHWERHGHEPSPELVDKTENIVGIFQDVHPEIMLSNNMNDYVTYGGEFIRQNEVVPCVAIEPSVENYHSAEEMVFVEDVVKVAEIVTNVLEG